MPREVLVRELSIMEERIRGYEAKIKERDRQNAEDRNWIEFLANLVWKKECELLYK